MPRPLVAIAIRLLKKRKNGKDKLNERNVPAQIRINRREEYKQYKRKLKKVIRESKKKADEEFGTKLSKKFEENKKLYFKEVEKVRRGNKKSNAQVRDENGRLLKGNKAVLERWRESFEEIMNTESQGRAVISCMGMERGGGRLLVQGPIKRREVKRAIGRLKLGKASGVDGITAEMLKFGGEAVIDWMHMICNLAWKQGVVPDDWVKAIMVPVYKGKGSKEECCNYRGISLVSIAGKVYGKIIIERVMEITESRISEEQGGFRRGRGCVDQIFTVKEVATIF